MLRISWLLGCASDVLRAVGKVARPGFSATTSVRRMFARALVSPLDSDVVLFEFIAQSVGEDVLFSPTLA